MDYEGAGPQAVLCMQLSMSPETYWLHRRLGAVWVRYPLLAVLSVQIAALAVTSTGVPVSAQNDSRLVVWKVGWP